VNTMMNLGFPYKSGDCLINSATVNVLRRILFHGVSLLMREQFVNVDTSLVKHYLYPCFFFAVTQNRAQNFLSKI
jgi:hypothetical protein